jgi:hypothetical protein
MIKPLQLQLALSIPELQDNRQFLEALSLQYKSYNLFEEMMEQELATKRVEFIQTMKESMVDMDKDGNEIKFFSSKFLVGKYLKLSDADLKLNDKLKQEEIEELNLAGAEGEDPMAESIDYNKLANMIVEKLSLRANLVEDKNESCLKDKPKKKKKQSDIDSEESKEEE